MGDIFIAKRCQDTKNARLTSLAFFFAVFFTLLVVDRSGFARCTEDS